MTKEAREDSTYASFQGFDSLLILKLGGVTTFSIFGTGKVAESLIEDEEFRAQGTAIEYKD